MNDSVYLTEKLSTHVYRICELGINNCFLVVGKKKAALIDCGVGADEIMPLVREITSLPVMLIASHAHVDHVGGAREFGKVYIHSKDLPITRWSNSFRNRIDFLKKHNLYEKYIADGRKLPVYKPYFFIKTFGDGRVFDLGKVKIEAVHTPGHTVGSCIFKISEDKIVLAGDNFTPYLLLHYDYTASLSEWVKSCEILFEKAKGCVIYGGHGRNPISAEGLMWQYENAKEIIAKTKKNDKRSAKKILTVKNGEHEHLIIKYRTDRII